MRNILLGEYHLPFDLHKEILEEDLKGLIFERKIYDSEFNIKSEYIGYFCSLKSLQESFIESTKTRFKLNEVRFIVGPPSDYPCITLGELYRELQNYRDATYQEAIWKVLAFCPINPTAIRLLESCIKPLPYEPQSITIDSLNLILDHHPKETGIFLIKEAANASAQLNIKSSREHIYSQLKNADSWNLT
ncbi:hypothetical protein [Pontibacterium sp.]|uniref:hypothetical protein n=1 Tax=Pontibacterium sp. TaxID=2036026 RepID=UPI0035110403